MKIVATLLIGILLIGIVPAQAMTADETAELVAARNRSYAEQVRDQIARRHELEKLRIEKEVIADRLLLGRDNVNVSQRASSYSRFRSDVSFDNHNAFSNH